MTAVAAETKKSGTDFVLLGVTLILTILGVLLIFDASYKYALTEGLSVYKFVRQQSIFAAVGICLMLLVARTPYTYWRKAAVGLMGASLVGLLLVYVPHLGIVHNHARRWIGHGSFEVQPSELAKLAVIIYIANSCAGRPKIMPKFWEGPFPPLCIVALIALMTEREPDLGTAIVIALAGLATLFFAGMKGRHLALCMAVGVVVLMGTVMMKHKSNAPPAANVAAVGAAADPGASAGEVGNPQTNYRMSRLTTFFDPEKDKQGSAYQVYQSLVALGSGGVFGMGIGTGRAKYSLPECYTDFIFAVLGEETGLIGTLGVVLLYGVLIGRGMHIAARTQDPFGALLASGISCAFGVQALLNIGVVTSSIPATGVPLPFLSYGGTSLVLSLLFVGILMSIHRFAAVNEAVHKAPRTPTTDRDFDRRWDRGATLSRPEYKREINTGPSRTRRKPVGSRH